MKNIKTNNHVLYRRMTDSQYLDKALDFIVEREQDDDYICELLHEIPEECEICRNDCQGLDRICVLKFLKYYKKKQG